MKLDVTRNRVLKQMIAFFCTSGVGWVIDFTIYTILTGIIHLNVSYGNIISSIPATTFVFLVSTRKTFKSKIDKIDLKYKYIIYICYQIVLVLIVSLLGQWIFNILIKIEWIPNIIIKYLNILVKIIITPITMITNFIVMKNLTEKL